MTEDTQALLNRLCAEVLGVDHVEATDDFFVLGGNSLLAMRLTKRVAAATGVLIPSRQLYERSVLADLAALTDELRASASAGQ